MRQEWRRDRFVPMPPPTSMQCGVSQEGWGPAIRSTLFSPLSMTMWLLVTRCCRSVRGRSLLLICYTTKSLFLKRGLRLARSQRDYNAGRCASSSPLLIYLLTNQRMAWFRTRLRQRLCGHYRRTTVLPTGTLTRLPRPWRWWKGFILR